MAEANWFWADGDKKNGPVAPAVIARLVADGKLGAEDLIWKEGMPDWIPVKRVPALVKYLKTPDGAPVAAAPVSVAAVAREAPLPVEDMGSAGGIAAPIGSVGYYNPSGSMPPRAAASLAKHSRPRGDVGDWPLDDVRVQQFDVALKYRKKIDGPASLFRLFLLLAVIGDIGLIAGIALAMMNTRSSSAMANVIGLGASGAVSLGLTILYYFAWKSTQRSQVWAPITMGILYVIGGLFYLVTLGIVAMNATMRDTTPMVVAIAFIELLAGVFAYVAFRAAASIPGYLRQPAWCQELLSKTSG